jgi:SHS2 domain-containing protein
MGRGYRQLEHTADLALELYGDDEAEVLVAGLEAMVAILTDGAPNLESNLELSEREVELDAVDPVDRMVRWLNEIVYVATVEGFIPAGAVVELGETGLRATLRGESEARSRLRTEIKSVTYHEAELRRVDGGWRARVVVDV